jgi:hypothetical protein
MRITPRIYGWCAAALLMGAGQLVAEPVISEFVAENVSGLRDEDGTLQDWIEIHNPSTAPFSIAGWSLTDSAGSLGKWRFPAVTMAPGEFLVVFASGKDRRVAGGVLHTNFSLAKGGEYLALVRPDGVTVEQQYAPKYPPQDADRGFGLMFNRTVLVADGASASYLVPGSAGALAANWNTAPVTPAGWTLNKPLGLGYGFNVAGLTITVRAKNTATGTLDTQASAELLLSRPSGHSDIANEQVWVQPTFNVLGNGGDGHYGSNNPLPLWAQEDYVVRAQGTISVPVAGVYTFGINSDDGGKIKIDGAVVMDDPTLHGPADHLGTVMLTAGNHVIDAYFWERGGGDEGELFARAGSVTAWDSSFRLVGDVAGGGLAAFTTPVGTVTTAAVRTNVEGVMRNVNASCFVRVPFTVAAGAGGFTSASLLMRYNDGFRAWLNGVVIGEANAPAGTVWNGVASAARPGEAATVATAFNVTSALPGLVNGTNLLAVHGMNVTAADGNFLVLPEMVAGSLPEARESAFFNRVTPGGINTAPDSLGKVADTVFSPRRGFYPNAVVGAVPFAVTISSATPGALIRYTTDGSEPTPTNGTLYSGPVSIGRTTVLRAMAYKENWEATNVDTHSYLIPDDIVVQSPTGAAPGPGWPAPGNSVNGQAIDYGMDPDIVNSTNAAIGGVARVKAALLAIPSVSMVTDPASLWNAGTGIYVNAGGRGLGWERQASMEILNDPAGGIKANCGIRIRGGYSRSADNPKRSFHVYFRAEYGDGKLNYPVFGDAGAETFNQIDLRTSQNYSWSFGGDPANSFLREEFTRQTHVEMGKPDSHVKYVHLYLNGQYWGLYEFDERTEADHCSEYIGGDKANWDVVKCEQSEGYVTGVTDGYEDAWIQLARKANPVTVPGGFTRRALTAADYYDMQGLGADGVMRNGSPVLLDPDALIDYMLLTFWSGNLDGATSAFLGNETANNWFGARDRTGGRGFVYFVHDFEHALFNPGEDRTGPFNRVFSDAGTYVEKTENRYNPMFLHADLLDVVEYRVRWHDRVQRYLFNGGVLSQAANTARVQRLAAVVDACIMAESARWGDAKTAVPLNRTHWLVQRDTILTSYLPARTANVISQLRADGLYPVVDAVSHTPAGGYVASTTAVTMSGPAGRVWYYTTDGSDPRLAGGGVNSAAKVFTPSGLITENLVSDGVAGPGATWKYRDPSIDLGGSEVVAGGPGYGTGNWKHPQFDDSSGSVWKSGDAELGAGDGGERTVINIGATNARAPVVYFRKKFTVTNPAQYNSLELEALIDDGAIFYLNGKEIGRMNMPSGAVGYSYTNLNALNEGAFLPVTDARIVPGALVAGENTMCVQVHQANNTSSDLSFDMRLRGRRTVVNSPVYLAPGEQVVKSRAYDAASGGWSALSEVTYLVDAEPASSANLVISELHYRPAGPSGEEVAAGYGDDRYFEYMELENIGPRLVDLSGIRFNEGVSWVFDASATVPRLLAPGARVLVVGHREAFARRYGAGLPVAGVFSGQLDNGGEMIGLVDAGGAVIRRFAYGDQAPWPADADGNGPSLVLMRPERNPDPGIAANWRLSASTGNPGAGDAVRYADWKQANAPGAGDASDGDGDGMALFMEYALGGSPGRPDTGLLPVAGVEAVVAAGGEVLYQTISVTVPPGRDDAVFGAETSTGLATWDGMGVVEVRRLREADGTEVVTWRSVVPLEAVAREFLRVRVRQP